MSFPDVTTRVPGKGGGRDGGLDGCNGGIRLQGKPGEHAPWLLCAKRPCAVACSRSGRAGQPRTAAGPEATPSPRKRLVIPALSPPGCGRTPPWPRPSPGPPTSPRPSPATPPQVVFEKGGVYLHTSAKKHQDPDSLIAGVIRVVEKVTRGAAPGRGLARSPL